MTEIPKVYDPQTVEPRWYPVWLERGYFQASLDALRPRYCIVIPPPNITGSLHLGHALNNTLQDVLVRWKRMEGYNVLWVPGTDHAGIATQNVVERQLKEEGISREQLGREKFIKRVKQWREQLGRTIIEQLKRLGASCDWSRERFTLDEGLSEAVREVFVRLYEEGLIYRGERLINWCPRCQTALSDIEVEHEETSGKMYYIKYPLADEPETFLTVATTRPETMLGDTAVAVHPDDPRYKHLLAQKKEIKLPLTTRTIPIVGDSILVDREFGTGAVKITPGHDFNDEKAGQRHHLPTISLLDQAGRMGGVALSQEAKVRSEFIENLVLKSVPEARKLVVQWLEQEGHLIKIEDHRHAIGKCYRCKTVVEPYRSPQWFVKVNDPQNSLAQPAIEAVRSGRIRMIPEAWKNNYFGWMENIQDWCISRQIWWGHQIPAWYCKKCNNGSILEVGVGAGTFGGVLPPIEKKSTVIGVNAKAIVQREAPKGCPECRSTDMVQDPDVLDTWFSSALWPFSTLGWPKATDELKIFYPTDTLVTSFDILFFWVARMIMMGLKFMGQIPFKDVYIHALVRDAEGQKMSKSKGNVIDPLGVMEKYGTDALRFTLAAMASPGRDIKLSEQRIEGYRNFANKIWNAARFVLMNLKGGSLDEKIGSPCLADRWIRVRLRGCIDSVTENLKAYRFDEAANQLYQFTWHEYCDWYLELIKPRLSGGVPETDAAATRATMVTTLETLLRLLHPFMPFITEEIWQKLPHRGESIVVSPYPKAEPIPPEDQAREGIMEEIISIIKEIRRLRGELNIPPKQPLKAGQKLIKPDYAQTILQHGGDDIQRLAGLSEFTAGPSITKPSDALVTITKAGELFVEGIDLRKALPQVEKKLALARAEFELADQKWKDKEFQKKAPEEVRIQNDLRRGELSEQVALLSKLRDQIKQAIGDSSS